jgi:hypothetical protein
MSFFFDSGTSTRRTYTRLKYNMFVKFFWAVYSVLAKYSRLFFKEVRRSPHVVDVSGRFSFQEGEKDFQMLNTSILLVFITAKSFVIIMLLNSKI